MANIENVEFQDNKSFKRSLAIYFAGFFSAIFMFIFLGIIVSGHNEKPEIKDQPTVSTESKNNEDDRTINDLALQIYCNGLKENDPSVIACNVNRANKSIDVRLDTNFETAKVMCAMAQASLYEKKINMLGFSLRILSPYNTNYTLAVCRLPG